MTNIVATVATTPTDFPAGVTAAGNFDWALFAVGSTTPVATQQTPGNQAIFQNVAAGDYTVACRRLAADNTTQISSPLTSGTVTVPASPPPPPPQFDAPSSITVVLSQ